MQARLKQPARIRIETATARTKRTVYIYEKREEFSSGELEFMEAMRTEAKKSKQICSVTCEDSNI